MRFKDLTIELQAKAYQKAKEWFEQDGIYDKEAVMEYLNDKDNFEIIDCSPDEDGTQFTVEF